MPLTWREFPRGALLSLIRGYDTEGYDLLDDVLDGGWSAGTEHQLVFMRGGCNWAYHYRRGLDGEPVETTTSDVARCYEVRGVEVTVVQWVPEEAR